VVVVFIYGLLLVSLAVAVFCLGQVWLQGLAHALDTRRSRKLFWVAVMLVFGPLGALTYWAVACPRSA
jgi:hypothetical protein